MAAVLLECGHHEYGTAIIGLSGVVIGGILTGIVAPCVQQWLAARQDKPRKECLKKMLVDDRFPDHWRNLDTLMHVIGANEETTKRLLLEIGARGSEDGQPKWGLFKYHPFPKQ